MKKIQVDVTDAASAKLEARRCDVGFRVVEKIGPGGSNPLVELTGSERDVNRLLKRWGYDSKGYAF